MCVVVFLFFFSKKKKGNVLFFFCVSYLEFFSMLIGIIAQIRFDSRRYLDGRRRIGTASAAAVVTASMVIPSQTAQVFQ